MFPHNVAFLGRERDQERFQEAEHIRLVKIARGQHAGDGITRKLVNWLGYQMMKWGAKMQGYSAVSLPEAIAMEITEAS